MIKSSQPHNSMRKRPFYIPTFSLYHPVTGEHLGYFNPDSWEEDEEERWWSIQATLWHRGYHYYHVEDVVIRWFNRYGKSRVKQLKRTVLFNLSRSFSKPSVSLQVR